MTHEADLTPNAGAALLNIGTLDEEWVKRYHAVARSANASGVPLILDPVGAGATTLRTRTATELLSRYSFACVKGNTGEMGALAGDTSARVKGVDTAYKPQNPHEVVLRVARRFKTVAVMTGKVDYISDGHNIVEIYNNSSLLGNTTGSGCSAASVIAAFVASQKCVHDVSPLEAVSAGLSVYLIAAEKAFKRLDALNGPASYWSAVVDELFKLTKDDVIERARIRLVPHKM
jgi:hydroxyethylthiazole kinase